MKTVLLVIGFTLVSIHLAGAQQPAKILRIGYVSGTGDASNQGPYVEALRQGLRELGHVEGRTFAIEYRGAEGKLDRLPSIMNELVQLKVDVLVAPFTGAVRTARQATNTIPIVMVTGTDPVANGWVESLARPGGNITGVFTLAQDLNGKRLELLTEVVPRLSHVAVLMSVNDPASAMNHSEYEAAARALKVNLNRWK
jgi:putative tryptophan/tyrosine transport system substrate-binding protein